MEMFAMPNKERKKERKKEKRIVLKKELKKISLERWKKF